ncbi:E3 ubiquitin-protein ligase RNF181-like [Ornithodoros turicata]|uniref:E3 ubiquitin-protein ligase RNF181-like n=1 Tax=Ornithodoros turicata TaxID=34597 RepID=UPI003139F099
MASYYDEHNCTPLRPGQEPDHMLHLARLLIDGGYGAHFDMEYHRLFPDAAHQPPASKQAVASLKSLPNDDHDRKCPVCLKEFDISEPVTEMPCSHAFHKDCIIPWLNRMNSCPVCRFELPTDDPDYEAYKAQKERIKKREATLQELHNSMFG